MRWFQGFSTVIPADDGKTVYAIGPTGAVIAEPDHPLATHFTNLVTAGVVGSSYDYYSAGELYGSSQYIKFYGYSLVTATWSYIGQLVQGIVLAVEFNLDGVLLVWIPSGTSTVKFGRVTF